MKRYEFKIVVEEGNDEFWDEVNAESRTGADELRGMIASALFESGFDVEVKLIKFEDTDS